MIEDGRTFPMPPDVAELLNKTYGTVVSEAGAAQSDLGDMKPTLIPPEAILALSAVVGAGSKRYARNNWRAIPEEEHLDHVLTHLAKHMAGDRSEKHLWNALTRMAFAVAVADGHDYRSYKSVKAEPLVIDENEVRNCRRDELEEFATLLKVSLLVGESTKDLRARVLAKFTHGMLLSVQAKTGV